MYLRYFLLSKQWDSSCINGFMNYLHRFFYACFFKAVFIYLFTFSLLKASGLLYSQTQLIVV